jgi:serine/threonine protein phosphatase 1
MKRFVLGDVHGGYKALKQVLEASKLDYANDQLICLGDVADGWGEVVESFEELLKIKNLIYILGNHDDWLLDYLINGYTPRIWTSQGGQASMESYAKHPELMQSHRVLLETAMLYCVTNDNKLFVHGGFDWHFSPEFQSRDVLLWDRELFNVAQMWERWNHIDGREVNKVKLYDEVFIGHTSTSYTQRDLKPVHVSNVWNLDQGAGWEGKLTLMDIDSKEYWQSDLVFELYPEEKGRK